AGWNGDIDLWHDDGRPWQVLEHTSQMRLTALAFSRDGRWLAAGGVDHTVQVWDLAEGRAPSRALLQGHDDKIVCLAWSPDGDLLASGGTDGDVRLWRIAGGQGEAVAVLRGHRGSVGSVPFTPDRRGLWPGGEDGDIQGWPVATDPVGPLLAIARARVAAVLAGTPPASRIASMVRDGTLDATRAVAEAVANGDADVLALIAWDIVDPGRSLPAAQRDLALAQRAAEAAFELTHREDGAILDTLARVWWWRGDVRHALELQRQAVQLTPREDVKAALAEYERAVEALPKGR